MDPTDITSGGSGGSSSAAPDARVNEVSIFPLAGQLFYTAVAVINTAYPIWSIIGYRGFINGSSSYYDYWTTNALGDTNWWKVANIVWFYGSTFFWSLALISQLLSLIGVANSTNLLVW